MDDSILAVIGALAGATIGLLAGPVRDYFAHGTEIRNIRKSLYSELLIICQKLDGAFIDFGTYINSKNMDMLKSTDKMEYSGSIPFPVYDALKTQPIFFYQLEEASKFDAAYFRANTVNHAIDQFSHTSFNDIDAAKSKYRIFCEQLLEAVYVINIAFESNEHVLKKIDNGTLLKDWRKFVDEHPKIKAKLSRKRVVVDGGNGCL